MRDEITLPDCSDSLVQSQQLCERSRQLCEESRWLCMESQRQRLRNPWPHPVSPMETLESVARLADQPAGEQANDALVSQQPQPIETPADTETLQSRGEERVFTDQQLLDLIATVVEYLPLEQQIRIMKALCARTMAAVRARLDIKLVRSV